MLDIMTVWLRYVIHLAEYHMIKALCLRTEHCWLMSYRLLLRPKINYVPEATSVTKDEYVRFSLVLVTFVLSL